MVYANASAEDWPFEVGVCKTRRDHLRHVSNRDGKSHGSQSGAMYEAVDRS